MHHQPCPQRFLRLVAWILRLYPPAWRERYAAEMGALLEQHHITLWTLLDLLLGALDARLDPHYRRPRPHLPWQRLQTWWKILACALVTYWIALIPWFYLSDLGILPSDLSWCYREWPADYCAMRLAVGAHMLPASATLVASILPLAWTFFLLFLLMLVLWIPLQAVYENKWHWLRLLPIGVFGFYLFFGPPFYSSWWLNIPFVVALLLLVESGGAMLISQRRWQHPHRLHLALGVRLIILLTIAGMSAICVSCWSWLMAL